MTTVIPTIEWNEQVSQTPAPVMFERERRLPEWLITYHGGAPAISPDGNFLTAAEIKEVHDGRGSRMHSMQ